MREQKGSKGPQHMNHPVANKKRRETCHKLTCSRVSLHGLVCVVGKGYWKRRICKCFLDKVSNKSMGWQNMYRSPSLTNENHLKILKQQSSIQLNNHIFQW